MGQAARAELTTQDGLVGLHSRGYGVKLTGTGTAVVLECVAMGRFPYQNIGIDAWSSMPIAVTPSLYVTDTLCVGHMYHIMALP